MGRSLDGVVETLLPNIDVEAVLDAKGIAYKTLTSGWLLMRCLYPDHEDWNPSFGVNPQDLSFNCYGCKRHGTWTALCNDLGWEVSDNVPVVGVPRLSQLNDFLKFGEHQIVSDRVYHLPQGYKKFERPYLSGLNILRYLVRVRKLSLKVINKFEIGYTSSRDPVYEEKYIDRAIIPCHDECGDLAWPEGRACYKSKQRWYRPGGVKSERHLFNLHRAVETGRDWAIVVEGIIDAISIDQYGLSSVVASYGSLIHEEQMMLLTKHFSKIVFCHDIDKAGIESWVGFKEKYRGTGVSISRILLPRGEDANSIGKNAFLEYAKQAKKYW